jgi:hypothetical protein
VTLVVGSYEQSLQQVWDTFVRASKNGTFLFLRDYMDYHRDRFSDHSLLVMDGSKLVALLPANRSDDDIHSHQGLTYGGLLTADSMTTPLMLDVFAAVLRHLREAGARRLFYKTTPTIYHRLPAEEDRYALFLADAALCRRDVLSVVPQGRPVTVQGRRRRGAAKAGRLGVTVGRSDDWAGYWALLADNLMSRHHVTPVHSLAEMEQFQAHFPNNIHLHLAHRENEILAGVVIYESAMVAHVQYVASSQNGRDIGALDRLFFFLLNGAYAEKPFFDFGISNEEQGRVLNRGLIEEKEGFGARAVVHDFYELEL